MDSSATPDATLNKEVVVAMDIWGNPVRARLFEYIRSHPSQFFGQIYAATRSDIEAVTGKNFSEPNLSRHLRAMREAGVLTIDLPEDMTRGRTPRYDVDEERADELIDKVAEFVDGYRKRGRNS